LIKIFESKPIEEEFTVQRGQKTTEIEIRLQKGANQFSRYVMTAQKKATSALKE
jgi:hypothetical protein